MIIAGGSRYYRGEFGSDIFTCHLYDPATNRLSTLASPTVGRDYHSEGLLLPDGRIVTLGGNPLFGDSKDTTPGFFETRIEIYSPPYLYHGARPRSPAVPVNSPVAGRIPSPRRMRPRSPGHGSSLRAP